MICLDSGPSAFLVYYVTPLQCYPIKVISLLFYKVVNFYFYYTICWCLLGSICDYTVSLHPSHQWRSFSIEEDLLDLQTRDTLQVRDGDSWITEVSTRHNVRPVHPHTFKIGDISNIESSSSFRLPQYCNLLWNISSSIAITASNKW